jgi:hypothetical protein
LTGYRFEPNEQNHEYGRFGGEALTIIEADNSCPIALFEGCVAAEEQRH